MSAVDAGRNSDRLSAALELVRRARHGRVAAGNLKLLQAAVDLAPASLRTRTALARRLADCGRELQAIDEWEYVLQATRCGEAGTLKARRYCAMACRELAALLWRNGDGDRARRLHQLAIRTELQRHGSLSGRTLLNALEAGAPDMSPESATPLLRGIVHSGSRRERAEAQLRLAQSAAECNEVSDAVRMIRRAVRLATGPRARGEALTWYGCLLIRTGMAAKGERMLRRGVRCLLQIGDHAGSQRLLRLAQLVETKRAQQRRLQESN